MKLNLSLDLDWNLDLFPLSICTMSLSRKDMEDLRPMVDRTVHKFLGFSEGTLSTAALNCLDKGYDKRKTVDKLSAILDKGDASKFADKLFDLMDGYRGSSRHGRSRKRKEDTFTEEVPEEKKSKMSELPPPSLQAPIPFPVQALPPDPSNPSPGQLTAEKIKEMMANAQKMIQQRKAQLQVPTPIPSQMPTQSQLMMTDALDKAKKVQELQASIKAKMNTAGLGGALASIQAAAKGQGPPKMANVIVDQHGRTIDASTGEEIQLTHHMPTLKANIRAKRRELFKTVQEKPPEEISETKYFDPRVSLKNAIRQRRGFKFHDKGKFQEMASKLRAKAQLEKLQSEIAQAAKKTGIASAAKLATIQPKKLEDDQVSSVEWWDAVILRNETYDSLEQKTTEGQARFEGVINLIEHPRQMRPPAEPDKMPEIPVILTAKERKKLRRQTRSEAQKELQEKIRLGLLPPPEPKVRMANLMRVLGTEAVQDPTKVEAHVRAQMAKRQRAHEEANAARKLSKDERREKKIKKLKEDTSLGVHVSVYRVHTLSDPAKRFKVETNANQLFLTGIVVLHKDCNVVVVEGGPKQQKKYRRLMMHRIKWSEDRKSKKDDDDEDQESRKVNQCDLVWEGMVKNRAFGEMKFKMCPTENFAREQFRKLGVEHYWDLAFRGAILETASEEA